MTNAELKARKLISERTTEQLVSDFELTDRINGGQNMYELVIIWFDGGKDIYPYQTEEEARQGERNMRMAFGNQVSWAGVRKSRG